MLQRNYSQSFHWPYTHPVTCKRIHIQPFAHTPSLPQAHAIMPLHYDERSWLKSHLKSAPDWENFLIIFMAALNPPSVDKKSSILRLLHGKKIIFVKGKILSIEIILSTYTYMHTHTGTCTHVHSNYTKPNLHSLKWAAIRDLRRMKTAARNRKHGRSTVLEKIIISGYIWTSPETVFVREEGEGHSITHTGLNVMSSFV